MLTNWATSAGKMMSACSIVDDLSLLLFDYFYPFSLFPFFWKEGIFLYNKDEIFVSAAATVSAEKFQAFSERELRRILQSELYKKYLFAN